MWENVDKTIKRIESRIELITKTTDSYDPQYCSKDNEDCSLKYSHTIAEFVHMKNYLSLCMSLNYTVHPLMNVSLSWKILLIQYGRII